MSDNTVQRRSNNRWLLPAGLVILILLILAGAYWATHPHLFAAKATPTPTATSRPATATPRPGPTGTPRPGPTGTPRPGATSAPTAAPTHAATATPRPSPTALNGVHAGTFTHTQAEVNTIQQGANRGESAYTFYTDPFRVVSANLPHYNFNGSFSVVAPPTPPAATPTPSTNAQGQPTVTITVTYRGAKYAIVLIQPVQHGPKGIWVISQIRVV
jgi:hypothetical protein